MTSARSAGDTQREWAASGIAARLAGVSRIDGATALTQICSSLSSCASAWVSAATADLEAVYAVIPAPSRGSRAGRAETLTIRPPGAPPLPAALRARKAATAAAEHKKQESAFMWNCAAKSAEEISAI